MASPYEGRSRAPLRVGLALLSARDAVGLAVTLAENRRAPSTEGLGALFLLPAALRVALVGVVALAVCAAAFRFARRSGALGEGLVVLLGNALLVGAHTRLAGGAVHNFYVTGAVLVGWTAGLAWARARRLDGDMVVESLAEAGAAGALGAIYVGAVTSKLATLGASWVDADTLRAIVLAQHPVSGGDLLDRYASMVGESPRLAGLFAWSTMVIQASGLLYPLSRLTRAVAGTLLLGFHINVALLTPILYAQSVVLLTLFSFPWPTIVDRLRSRRSPSIALDTT